MAKVLYFVIFLGGMGLAFWPRSSSSFPSVIEASYGPLRNGTTKASFFPLPHYSFKRVDKSFAAEAGEAQPIVLNMRSESKEINQAYPAYRGLIIIVFVSKDGHLNAYDFSADSLLWRIRVEDLEYTLVGNHPYFDQQSGRIFFRTRRALHGVDLDGTKLESWQFDPAAFLPTRVRDEEKYQGRIFCNTGLALSKTQEGRNLLFGCSSPSGYGTDRGRSGFVLGFPITEAGRFERSSGLKTWLSSQRGQNPKTGFASGIWMSGSPPAVLPNGDFLVSVGNGPFLPKEKNFGCSLVRVNGRTFQTDSAGAWYHRGKLSSLECFADNLDLSSSGPSLLETQSGWIGGVLGKDGIIKVYDPQALPGEARLPSEDHYVGSFSYGQVNLFLNPHSGRANLIAAGDKLNLSEFSPEFLATENGFPNLRFLERAVCLGFVRRAGPPDMGVAVLGRAEHSQEVVNAPIGSQEYRDMTRPGSGKSFGHADHNVKGHSLLYSQLSRSFYLEQDPIFPPGNWRAAKMSWIKNRYEKYILAPAAFTGQILRQGGKLGLVLAKRDAGAYITKTDRQELDCENPPGKDWLPLYSVSYYQMPRDLLDTQLSVSSFEVQPDRSLRRLWLFRRPLPASGIPQGQPREELYNTNFVTALSVDEKQGAVILPVKAPKPYLQLIDSYTGKNLGALPFDGEAHFSFPLVFGKFIVLPTQHKGLVIYEAKFSIVKYMRQRLLRLFSREKE